MDKIKIQIDRSIWRDLNSLKKAGESFNNVVSRLIEFWWKNQEEGEL